MKNFLKKLLTVVITLVVTIFVLNFLYPYMTKSNVPNATVATQVQIQNQAQNSNTENSSTLDSSSTSTNASSAGLISSVEKTLEHLVKKQNGSAIFYGVSKDDLTNKYKFPNGSILNNKITSLGNAFYQPTRKIKLISFTAPEVDFGYYSYIAWPTSYEDGGVYSCSAVAPGDEIYTGTKLCFRDGVSPEMMVDVRDFLHRTVEDYVDSSGKKISYELYRLHNPINPGTSVYYSVQ